MFASRYKLGSIDELRELSLNISRILVFCAIPISIIFLIYADNVLSIFGSEYKIWSNLFEGSSAWSIY